MKITRILLSSILLLGISSIALNAQDKKEISSENNSSTKTKNIKEKSTNFKNSSSYNSYKKRNSDYTSDKYQRGSISTH